MTNNRFAEFWRASNSNKILISILGTILFCCFCFILVLAIPIDDTPSTLPDEVQVAKTVPVEVVLNTPTALPSETLLPTDTPTQQATPTLAPSATPSPVLSGVEGALCIPDTEPETGKVTEVVDGDTIKVLLDSDGMVYPVRYIGMDTPEDTSSVEYFGPQATQRNWELVGYKTVTMFRDLSETDRYGRLLRYVIADGVFVNYALVVEGYAKAAYYPPDDACAQDFVYAERIAAAAVIGVWGVPPTLAPLPTSAPPPSNGGGSQQAVCNCGGNIYNCADFSTHASAQACYNYCMSIGRGDIHRLDGDSDGIACESLP